MSKSILEYVWCIQTLIYVSSFVGAIAFLWWWYSNSTLWKCCSRLPVANRFIATYIQVLRIAYKAENPGVIVLQVANGIIKVFNREKLILVWAGLRPAVVFCKPEAVEALVNNSSAISKGAEYRYMEPWLGKGLLTSSGERWKRHRKLLTPAFHFRILDDFMSVFDEQSAVMVEKIESLLESPWVDITALVTKCTLDIICETAMGVRMNVQSGGCKEYVDAIHVLGKSVMYRALRPWLWNDFIFYNLVPSGWQYCKHLKRVKNFTKKVIKSKKEFMLEKETSSTSEEDTYLRRKKPFLELLLEHHLAHPSFTEEDVREEVDTFMFEGHDTTSMGISWTLYTLGLYQDVQENVFQELSGIFQDCWETPVTGDHLKEMKYMECVIKESMRLFPPVPLIGRELEQSIQILDYTLEPGIACLILPTLLHHDAEQFPIPEKFDPDRFLPDNSLKRHPYAYIPFSAGSRNCIGQRFALMEIKAVLTHIIRKFKVISLDPRDKVHTNIELILRSAKPLRMKFCLRHG